MFVRLSRPQASFTVTRFADKNPFVDSTEWKPHKKNLANEVYKKKLIEGIECDIWHTHSILALGVLSKRHECNRPTSTWKPSAEIQGDLGDKNRKCFGTSNSLVTEFVCWKQFWSNSTSKGKGRPRGMSAGLGRVRPRPAYPRPVWEPGAHGLAGQGKESEKAPESALMTCCFSVEGSFILRQTLPAATPLWKSEGALEHSSEFWV